NCSGHRRGVVDGFALGVKNERSPAGAEAGSIVLVPEAPLQAQLGRGEIVRWIGERLLVGTGDRHGYGRIGGDTFWNAEPSVVGPLDGKQQKLTPQSTIAILVGVDSHVPLAVRCIHKSAVTDRQPPVMARGRVRNGVVGRVFPGPIRVPAAGADDGVAGGRAGGAAFCDIQVVVAIMLNDLWAF